MRPGEDKADEDAEGELLITGRYMMPSIGF